MASKMDFGALRQETMTSGASGAVTVNTRALIDKVLARYSSEWTTLRELIQNAADAGATRVNIKFETVPSVSTPVPNTSDHSLLLRHVIAHHTLQRLVVMNNGTPFTDTDWARLKSIAEGNPDETKIGAFGVGFYSVFADCDSPFVISGKKTMAFFYGNESNTKNSLLTREGVLPEGAGYSDTSFVLDYRSHDGKVPDLASLSQFLCTSLTFVNLENIDLRIDDHLIFSLTKKLSEGIKSPVPTGLVTRTEQKIFEATGVVHQTAQIDAQWANAIAWKPAANTQRSEIAVTQESRQGGSFKSFFSKLTIGSNEKAEAAKRAALEKEAAAQRAIAEDLSGTSQATVFLRMVTIHVKTNVNKSFSTELERATKKAPPRQTRLAVLTSSFEESAASVTSATGLTSSKAKELFSTMMPTENGRIFIGFPTVQTTGLLCHIFAPSLIPTVEREAVDLSAKYVRDWNKEMLRVAGLACRIAYNGTVEQLKGQTQRAMTALQAKKVNPAVIASVMPQALHAFQQYTVKQSTPQAQVGQLVDEAFWRSSSKLIILVLSTQGVLNSPDVRISREQLSFLTQTPLIPQELVNGASIFVNNLVERGFLSEITIQDLIDQLKSAPLGEAELVEFLKWTTEKVRDEVIDERALQALLEPTLVYLEELGSSTAAESDQKPRSEGRLLALGSVKYFQVPARIPEDLPVPPETIPFRLTKPIGRESLLKLGWQELHIAPWVQHLVATEKKTLISDKDFATTILRTISKQWESMSQAAKQTVVELFTPITVMPTKLGMRKPEEAYFPSVKLFEDLPVVSLSGFREKFLEALGVRKTIELSVVFERLLKPSAVNGEEKTNQWSHVDLIKYFASVQREIPARDMKLLMSTPICPAQGSDEPYPVSHLYRPNPALRALQLPVIQWPGSWRDNSTEAHFLTKLGLKPYPTVPEIIGIMVKAASQGNVELYYAAMRYYLENWGLQYQKFDVTELKSIRFLEIESAVGKDGLRNLKAPSECYTNEGAAIFGFNILRKDLHPVAQRFGVEHNPPFQECAQMLLNSPPQDEIQARRQFGYLATRVADIKSAVADRLSEAKIVPIFKSVNGKRTFAYFAAPTMCFLGDSGAYGAIFDFVDFGNEANLFLLKVGSKHEPSSVELARMLAKQSSKILQQIGETKYRDLLSKLAENEKSLKADKTLLESLKVVPFLLAYQDVYAGPAKTNKSGDYDDDLDEDENVERHVSLEKASNIMVIDTVEYMMTFRDQIKTAPQDEALEKFYQTLGAKSLSSQVLIEARVGQELGNQSEAHALQEIIIERTRIYLHDYPRDSISHDSKWLANHLHVRAVQSVTFRLSLRSTGVSFTDKRTAGMTQSRDKGIVLNITPNYEMFDVSRMLVEVLVKRPKQHDSVVLETILKEKLTRLKRKGYNVERILRQKEQEARIVETERQRLAEEEQRQQLQAREAQIAATPNGEKAVVPRTKGNRQSILPTEKMPGAFGGDSPQRQATEDDGLAYGNAPPQPQENHLTKFFRDAQRGLQTAAQNAGFSQQPSSASSSSTAVSQRPQTGPTNPSATESDVRNNLAAAIQRCRNHSSNSLMSAGSTREVEESKGSYCDSTNRHNITQIGTAAGIKVFTAPHVPPGSHDKNLMTSFAYILQDLAAVFDIQPNALHIFIDDKSSSIAFNNDGAIFCNYHYFAALQSNVIDGGKEAKIDALTYWYMVLCHELAHNLVQEHSAAHEFFLGSFGHTYMGRLMQLIQRF